VCLEAPIYCPTPELTQYVGDQMQVHYCNGLEVILPVSTQPADAVYNQSYSVMRFEVLADYLHKYFVSAHSFVAVGTGMKHEWALSVITGSHYSCSLRWTFNS
jgi:hypothetical protein